MANKLHVITYGCQMNEYDSERVAGLLRERQYELTADEREADVILLNTCAIREKAEEKVFSKLGELRRLKASRPDLVIGVMGPPTGQGPCGSLPTVWFNQLSSVNVPEFLQRIPRPAPESKAEGEHFVRTGHALLSRIVEEAANDGSQAIHRAKNYVAMRYPGIYAKTADATRQNTALTNVLGQVSPLGNGRTIVDVILEHTNRQTDVVERHFVRVDVTEELPFLVSQHLQPYYG